MKRKILIALGIVLAIVAVVAAVGLSARGIPETSRHAIDIEAWRALADTPAGERPSAVRVLQITSHKMQQGAVIEGGGFDEFFELRGYAFQVLWPDGGSIIIDPINDAESELDGAVDATWDAAAWEQLQQAMLRASRVVATHEHFDHVNGLTRSPHFDDLIGKAGFTAAQLGSEVAHSGIDARTRERAKPLTYTGTHALMRGVVLIEAPSHTPGSQLIYLRLADDTELLMVGDIAWNRANIERPAAHRRVVEWLLGEQGEETAHWLRAFHDLRAQHPEVHQIVAHDPETVEPLVEAGTLQAGFVTSGR